MKEFGSVGSLVVWLVLAVEEKASGPVDGKLDSSIVSLFDMIRIYKHNMDDSERRIREHGGIGMSEQLEARALVLISILL